MIPHVQFDPTSSQPPLDMSVYAQHVRETPMAYSTVLLPTMASDAYEAGLSASAPQATLNGMSVGSSTNAGHSSGDRNFGPLPAPIPVQAPSITPAVPASLLYEDVADAIRPESTTRSQLPYDPVPPSLGYSMAPPPVPMRPPTASSSRSATGAVRHRGRTGRMISRAREHIDGFRERSGTAEIHWSEVDAEGTWILMLVRASERGYEG